MPTPIGCARPPRRVRRQDACPQNIAIGTAACGLIGKDGGVMGRIARYAWIRRRHGAFRTQAYCWGLDPYSLSAILPDQKLPSSQPMQASRSTV